jgi:hypothetical protein
MPKKDFKGTIYLRYEDDPVAMALWTEIDEERGVHPQEFARRVLAAALDVYAESRRIRWPVTVSFAEPSEIERARDERTMHDEYDEDKLKGAKAAWDGKPDPAQGANPSPPKSPQHLPGSQPTESRSRGNGRKRGRGK